MRAGELNRQITFLIPTFTYDATFNEKIPAWSDGPSAWAQVITSGGREFYAAQKLNAETSAVFKIRYTERINQRMRIRYGIHIYEILGVADPDGRRAELLIAAKEVM